MFTTTTTSSLHTYLKVADAYIDLTLIVPIVIAIAGWIIAVIIQGYTLRKKHRIDIRYDIYKQFVTLHKKLEKNLHQFSANTLDPFLQMKGAMIPSTIEILNKSTSNCLQDANKIWLDYYEKLQSNYFQFNDEYLNMLYLFEDWNAPLEKLLSTTNTYSQVVNHLQGNIYKNLSTLQLYQSKADYDWRNWDQKEIKDIIESIKSDILDISYYTIDLMILIHNELLGKHFRQKRLIRKTTSEKYKVLTKKGICIRLDKTLIKKLAKNKKVLINVIEQALDTETIPTQENLKKSISLLKNGVCPKCKNKIDIYNIEKKDGYIFFKFTCGDVWETVIRQEKMKVKEYIYIKLHLSKLKKHIKKIFHA